MFSDRFSTQRLPHPSLGRSGLQARATWALGGWRESGSHQSKVFECLQRKMFSTLGKMAGCGIIPPPPLAWSYLLGFLCYWHSPGSSWSAARGACECACVCICVCTYRWRRALHDYKCPKRPSISWQPPEPPDTQPPRAHTVEKHAIKYTNIHIDPVVLVTNAFLVGINHSE